MNARAHLGLRMGMVGSLWALVAAGVSGGWPLFGDPQFRVLSDAPALACGDLDGDGVMDLVVANHAAYSLSVMLTDESCELVTTTTIGMGSGYPLRCVLIEDVDGDQVPDLVSSHLDSGQIGVTIGNGDGTYQATSFQAAGVKPCRLASLDVDLDDAVDLVAGHLENSYLAVLTNNGTGDYSYSFAPTLSGIPDGVASGLLDGDAYPDVVAAIPSADEVAVLINGTGGGFEQPVYVVLDPGSSPRAVAIVDVDGDSDLDLAIASHDLWRVDVALNAGDGTFPTVVGFDIGWAPSWIAGGDVDGDGTPDLVTANEESDTVSVLVNDGLGSFVVSQEMRATAGPSYVELADMDEDGDLEIVVSHNAGEAASVLVNDGAGWFSTFSGTATVADPIAMALVDVGEDGSGDLDAVVVSDVRQPDRAEHFFWIHHGDGAGGFDDPTQVQSEPMRAVAAADLDNDGDADLAFIDEEARNVRFYENDGAGGFAHVGGADGPADAFVLRIGELNNDGLLDVVVGGPSELSIILNQGGMSFGVADDYPMPDGLRDIAIGSLNGDAYYDLLVAFDDPSVVGDTSHAIFNDGTGQFGNDTLIGVDGCTPIPGDIAGFWQDWKPIIVSAADQRFRFLRYDVGDDEWHLVQSIPTGPEAVAMADGWLDASSGDDFAVADRTDGSVWVYKYLFGPDRFSAPTAYGVGTGPVDVSLGDMDGDGLLDAVSLSRALGEVSVNLRLDAPAPACAGDVDGDGDTDVFDFANLAVHFGEGPGANREDGDLSGDGYVNVFDFSILAGDFGCGS